MDVIKACSADPSSLRCVRDDAVVAPRPLIVINLRESKEFEVDRYTGFKAGLDSPI